MIIPTLLTALELGIIPAAGAIGLKIRERYARAAIQILRRDAQPALDQFARDNSYIKPLQKEFRETAEELLKNIRAAREMRASVLENAKKMMVPDTSMELIPELQMKLEELQLNFFGILKQVTHFKLGFIIKDQVNQRFNMAEGLPIHDAHLSFVDHHLVDLLNHLGVIDFAEHTTKHIDAVVSHFADHHIHFVDHAVDTVLFPWVISGTRAVIQEYNFLTNDESSFGDSLKHGIIPSALRTTLRTIGLSIDIALGWASLGFFTAAGIALGKILSKGHLESELGKLYETLNKHIRIIKERQDEALRKINKAHNKFRKSYLDEINKCPDIQDVPVLSGYIDLVARAHDRGMTAANGRVSAKAQQEKAKLPPTTRKQRFLGIDSNAELKKLYDAAERQLHSRHLSFKHGYAMAAQDHYEHAVEHLIKEGTFDNQESLAALKKMRAVTEQLPKDYDVLLSAWQKACEEMWRVGTKNIADVTHKEHEGMAVVAEREEGIMKPLRRKIRTLQKRLRHKVLIAA